MLVPPKHQSAEPAPTVSELRHSLRRSARLIQRNSVQCTQMKSPLAAAVSFALLSAVSATPNKLPFSAPASRSLLASGDNPPPSDNRPCFSSKTFPAQYVAKVESCRHDT